MMPLPCGRFSEIPVRMPYSSDDCAKTTSTRSLPCRPGLKTRHYRECHEVSTVRCDLKKPFMAERTKRRPTAKMGAQGIQFQTGRSIMATAGLAGSYKTITGTFSLPAIEFPSQSWKWTKRSLVWNSTMGIYPVEENDPEELRKFSCL